MELLPVNAKRSLEISELIKDGRPVSIHQARLLLAQWHDESPGDAGPYVYSGILAGFEENHDEALLHFIEASRLAPHEPSCWLNGARTYHALGRYQQSVEWSKRAIRVDVYGYLLFDALSLQATAQCEMLNFNTAEKIGIEIFERFAVVTEGFFSALWAQGKLLNAIQYIVENRTEAPLHPSKIWWPRRELVHLVEKNITPVMFSILEKARSGLRTEEITRYLPRVPESIKRGTMEYVEWWGAEASKEDAFALYIDTLQEMGSLSVEDAQKVQDLFDEEPTPYLIDAAKEYNRRVIASSLGKTVLRHG